jgi:hypothetical protein
MFDCDCQRCKKKLKTNEILYFKEIGSTKVWGIPMDVTVLRVCSQCYEKLTKEHDLEQRGLKQCMYCDTEHKIGEKCPNCGAP